jgi:hypothetical protein
LLNNFSRYYAELYQVSGRSISGIRFIKKSLEL